jgi:hypothetical protein
LAAKTVQLTTISGANNPVPALPTGPQLPVPPPPAKVVVDATVPLREDRFAALKAQLRVLRWPVALAVGVVLLLKAGSSFIDSARNEGASKGGKLADGISAANQEAAKNRAQDTRTDRAPQTSEDYLARGERPPPQPLPPPPPVAPPSAPAVKGTFDSVNTALAAAAAAAKSRGPDFAEQCRTLVAELRTYRANNPGLSVRELAGLQNVGNEVTAACEQENGAAGFEPIKDRVGKALRGEPL